jgi:hypothetical protein
MPGSVRPLKNGEGSRPVGLQFHGTIFCWSNIYPSWPNYCNGVREQIGYSGAPHDPDVIFKKRCSLPPILYLELFSHGLKNMKVKFIIFLGEHNHQI